MTAARESFSMFAMAVAAALALVPLFHHLRW